MRRLGFAILLSVLFSVPSWAAKPTSCLEGIYSGRHVFNPGQSPYCIEGHVIFDERSDVTVLPGTELRINPNAILEFRGRFHVESKEKKRVLFAATSSNPGPYDETEVRFSAVPALQLDLVTFMNVNRIQVWSCENFSITRSTFTNSENGLFLEASSGTVDRNTFSLTDAYSQVSLNAICLQIWRESGKITVSRNSFTDFLSKAEKFDNNYLGWAIRAASSFNLEISNNTIEDGYSGIFLWDILSADLSRGGIFVRDNTIKNVQVGIEVSFDDAEVSGSGSRVYIANNHLSTGLDFHLVNGFPHYGIILQRSVATVVDNDFQYLIPPGRTGATHSINLRPGSNSFISRNRFLSAGIDRDSWPIRIAFELRLGTGLGTPQAQAKYVIQQNSIEDSWAAVYMWAEGGWDSTASPDDRIVSQNDFWVFSRSLWADLPSGYVEDFSGNYWGGYTLGQVQNAIVTDGWPTSTVKIDWVAPVPFVF